MNTYIQHLLHAKKRVLSYLKILIRVKSPLTSKKEWEEFEYFDSKWENRVKKLSAYILPNESIMDLGCGQMTLKKYITSNSYIPVDYTKRDEKTIVCDFNKKEFPQIKADVIFISGCLEYIYDYEWFIGKACQYSQKILLSYCCIEDFPILAERKKNNWKNHLSYEYVILLLKENNFSLTESTKLESNDRIMVFSKI